MKFLQSMKNALHKDDLDNLIQIISNYDTFTPIYEKSFPGILNDDRYIKYKNDKKQEAFEKIGALKDPRSVEPIIQVLEKIFNDDRRHFKVAGIKALGKIGDPRALEILQKYSKDGHYPEVIYAARDAITAINGYT